MTAEKITNPNIGVSFNKHWDGKLETFAKKYGTTVAAIWSASKDRKAFKSLKSADEFAAFVNASTESVGITVPIPKSELAMEWETIKCGTSSLPTVKAVCDLRNKSARLQGKATKLSAGTVWNYLVNTRLRTDELEALLAAGKSPKDVEAIDDKPSEHPLSEVTFVRIPYVAPEPAQAAAVSPSAPAGATSTTLASPPQWVKDFWTKHLYPLQSALLSLIDANDRCEQLQREGAAESYPLLFMSWMLDNMTTEKTLKAIRDNVMQLRKDLQQLQDVAMEYMGINTAKMLVDKADADRKDAGKLLRGLLHNRGFLADLLAVLKQPDYTISVKSRLVEPGGGLADVSLKRMVVLILLRAYQELAISYESATALSDIDDAIDALGTAKGEGAGLTLPENSALAMLTSFAGSAASFTSNLVGDLPGPQSLGVAIVGIGTTNMLPWVRDWNLVARRFSGQRIANLSLHQARERFVVGFGRAAGFSADEADDFYASLVGNNREKFDAYTKRIEKSFYKTPRWNKFMFAVSAIGLIATIASTDDEWGRKYANIAGGTISTGLALATLVGSTRPDGAVAKALEKWGGALGNVGMVFSIISSAFTLWEGITKDDRLLITSGALGVAGGGLTLAGAILSCSWMGAVGTVIIAASILVSLYDTLTEIGQPTKRLFLSALKTFSEGAHYKKISTDHPALATAYKSFSGTVSSFGDFVALNRSPEIKATLLKLKFPDEVIEKELMVASDVRHYNLGWGP